MNTIDTLFTIMKHAVETQFDKMHEDNPVLYIMDTDKNKLWEKYLSIIPVKMNPIYRVNRIFDCSECRNYINNIGKVVSIVDNKVVTVWDTEKTGIDWIDNTFAELAGFVRSGHITDVFLTQIPQYGVDKNREMLEDGEVIVYEHFHAKVPKTYIRSDGTTVNEDKAFFRDNKHLLERGLTEITEGAIIDVLDLIDQGSLYKGIEWKSQLGTFLKYKKEYMTIPDEDKECYLWNAATGPAETIARIRNTSIGTLLQTLSEGMNIEEAVSKYEKIVAPENYKRPKMIYTKRMIEDAEKAITDLGYINSLKRRYAVLDDITVNNILFANRDASKRIGGAADIFESMKEEVAVDPNKVRTREIGINEFINDVIPKASSIELLLENRFSSNMVSLIAPSIPDSKSMFKWDNNFSWAYSGNLTDSPLRQRVKAAGGNIEGDLRFSIQWNDGVNGDEWDRNDEDAHCIEPNGHEIFFGSDKKPRMSSLGGQLDIDIINPLKGYPAVENIYYNDRNKMMDGMYLFFVHCYTCTNGKTGFRAEIEFDGNIYSFSYDKPLRQNEVVKVAAVILKDGKFTIQNLLPYQSNSVDVWGLKTNQFVPVTVVMYSPNYWDDQYGIGNQHIFMMLKGCVNPEQPNPFFNEYLKDELVRNHKRVFEALAYKAHVEDSDDQLSGVGFSLTQHNKFIVKVTSRDTVSTYKVKI